MTQLKILIDSTVLIDIERKNEETLELVESMTANNEQLIISVVTVTEILTGAYLRGRRENLSEAKTLLAQFLSVPLTEEIADRTAQYLAFLLDKGSPIDFKDIAIAATFSVLKGDFLLTQNKKHFEVMPELGNAVRTVSEFKKIYR